MSIQVATFHHDANAINAHLFWHGGDKFEVLYTDADGRSDGRESGNREFAQIAIYGWAEMVHERQGSFTRKDEIALRDIGFSI
jgi:hypothetical protein